MMRCLVLLFCSMLPLTARAATCPGAPYVDVRLETRQDPARIDYSRNLAALQTMQIDNSLHRPGQGITMGAAASRLSVAYQLKFQTTDLRNGTFCAAAMALEVTVAFTGNIIYIASELPVGSCIQNEVLQHERKHMNTDLQLTQDWRYRMEQDIRNSVRAIGQLAARSPEQAKTLLQARLDPIIERQTTGLISDRNQRQALVDTTSEYTRISRACNGEGQKYVRNYLRKR